VSDRFRPDPRGKHEEENTPIAELRALLEGLQHDAERDCEAQPVWRDPKHVLSRINRAVELFEIVAARFSRTTDALNARGGSILDKVDWEGLPERFGKVVVDHMEQAKVNYGKRSAEWKKRKEE
jgi:hypothetical protein